MITTALDTAAIFRREFRSRRDLLLAATYIAVLIAVMPYLPFIADSDRADVRDLSSAGAALAAGLALSLGLGASFFGRDLSEGRLGFFFERPVRSVAVWLGRFLAVLVLVVMCEGLILLPLWLGSGSGLSILTFINWPSGLGAAGWTAVFVAGPALLLLLAHALGVMVRARTLWMVLDLLGFTGAGIIAWLCLRPFVAGRFDEALLVVGLALAGSFLLALLAAFAVGVHCGRCDLARVHRVLSITLWSVAVVTFGGVVAYSAWLSDFDPSELRTFGVGPVTVNGEWIEVQGKSPGRFDVRRHFLISTTDSRWMKVPSHPNRWRWSIRFSGDGNRALWLTTGGEERPGFVSYVDLDKGGLESVTTSIVMDGDANEFLSEDGSRLAIEDDGVLSIYDLDSERLLTAVRLPEELHDARGGIFVDASTIRFYARSGKPGDWTMSITEVNADSGAIDHTGSFDVDSKHFWSALDAELQYLAATSWRVSGSSRVGNIFDARTGEWIRPVADFAAFLHDGRVLRVIREGRNEKSVVVEHPTGENSVVRDLPDVRDYLIFGEGLPGHLLLAHVAEVTTDREIFQVDLFNLETGATESVGKGLSPVAFFDWAYGSGWYRRKPIGQRLFRKDQHTLVRWHPDSGELVPVIVAVGGE
jgi:hypothetical protein